MRTMITLTLARVWSNVSHTLLAERQTGITKPALSEVAQTVKRLLQCGRPGFDPWVGETRTLKLVAEKIRKILRL